MLFVFFQSGFFAFRSCALCLVYCWTRSSVGALRRILDCTKVFISRPGGPACNQNNCYSGFKRAHCSVYLTITTSDGLIMFMYGPKEGRRHDMSICRKRNFDEAMQRSLMIEGEQFMFTATTDLSWGPGCKLVLPRVWLVRMRACTSRL